MTEEETQKPAANRTFSKPNVTGTVFFLLLIAVTVVTCAYFLLAMNDREPDDSKSQSLSSALPSKKLLAKETASMRFDASGEFKIVQFSDIHWKDGTEYDVDAADGMTKILQAERPDLVVFNGDLIHGEAMQSKMMMQKSLLQSLGPTLRHNVSFTFTFGNHDDAEGVATSYEKSHLYAELLRHHRFIGEDRCKNISGLGNHIIRIGSDSDQNCSVLVFLDSGMMPDSRGRDDFVKRDQVQWLSDELAENGACSVYAFFHIAVGEYATVATQGGWVGQRNEVPSVQREDTGLFSLLRTYGAKAIVVGHDHSNDFDAELDGVRLLYGRVGGWPDNSRSWFGKNNFPRGARVLQLKRSGAEFDTWIRLYSGEVVVQSESSGIWQNLEKLFSGFLKIRTFF